MGLDLVSSTEEHVYDFEQQRNIPFRKINTDPTKKPQVIIIMIRNARQSTCM